MRSFIVLKFGGTSVATRARWDTIRLNAKARLEEGLRPVIVCSAVSGVSNALEGIIRKIAEGTQFEQDLKAIEKTHIELAKELAVDFTTTVLPDLRKLEQILLGASLVQEVTPRLHAQIMAFGEILATKLGAVYLSQQDVKVSWQDARECLLSRSEDHAHEQRSYLAAICPFDEDKELQERFVLLDDDVILTQGFIARNHSGHTVLLGRGGSDTSASYFAAKLNASRCEIWTDVPGLYTANPRQIPTARILSRLDYDEAQEMASMGAKVLHPRCIAPVKTARIPLHIRSTNSPELPGTVIAESQASGATRVKCISTKTNVSLISVESLGMWQEVGFLADLFTVFKTHGLSIDLVSTSETNVTVSIDPLNNALLPSALDALVKDLSGIGKVKHLGRCAAVSLVGRNIRSILHQLGPALRVFEEQKVFLVSQAASDLNLTFVVQEDEATRLVQELHHLLFDQLGSDPAFGASWQDTFERTIAAVAKPFWWQERASTLLHLSAKNSPLYVYDAATLRSSAKALQSLRAVDRVFYAMKANNNADVLKTFYDLGLGFECVSVAELDYLFGLFPNINPDRVLFTPNFAGRAEYVEAFRRKCQVTLDNLYPLEHWLELFAERRIFLRLDPGQGLGHHKHVRTAGEQSKFGISQNQIAYAASLIERCNAIVIGLHAHAGSGITKPSHWVEMADFLMSAAQYFPHAEILNLGGGLFVPSNIHDDALDLAQFDEALVRLKNAQPQFQFWLEPGRFLVANAGVLLTQVTQLKEKGDTRFIGVDTGMNSLIRPALYGAHHHIANLTRMNEPLDITAHIVGPICESGDTLGYDRKLPKTYEGDVLLIATAGAYGKVMSSAYNLREPAREYFLPESVNEN